MSAPIPCRPLVFIRESVVRNAAGAVSPERHGWLAVEKADIYADAEGHRSGRTAPSDSAPTLRPAEVQPHRCCELPTEPSSPQSPFQTGRP